MIRIIKTGKAPLPMGAYVQAVKVGNLILISGQIPLCTINGQIPKGIENQTQQALENIKYIVEMAGSLVANIVKTTLFFKDLNDLQKVNTIYEAFFYRHNAPFPARSCVEVSRLPYDVEIKIEAIAACCHE